jgi:serine/threonine-protein kinase
MISHTRTASVPQPGDIVAGKYAIDRLMSPGGMGVVAEARHLELGTRVAIKFLLDEGHENQEIVQRFIREARATSELSGEHVVRVHDVGRLDTGAPYMVMEYLAGHDLKEELRQRGPLPCTEAVDFLLQGCEALAEAHARGIVHRDIKPSNLFLTRRPDGSSLIKVLDFGISKIESGESDHSLTATAEVIGSPQYMSPEQVRSARLVDSRTDIWSLGVLLYELVSDQAPFSAATLSAISAMIVADPPVPLSKYRRDLPRDLEAIVMRCLEKDRDKRFQSVAELARALGPLASAGGRLSAERATRISRDSLTGVREQTLRSEVLPSDATLAAPDERRQRQGLASGADASGEATTVASSGGVAAKSDDSKISTLSATEGAARKPSAHGKAWWIGMSAVGVALLAIAYFIQRSLAPSTDAARAADPPAETELFPPANSSTPADLEPVERTVTVEPVSAPNSDEPARVADAGTRTATRRLNAASKPLASPPEDVATPESAGSPPGPPAPTTVDPLGDRK